MAWGGGGVKSFEEVMESLPVEDGRVHGIGTEREQTVHRVIKYWLSPDPACHEVRIGRRIADVLEGGRVYEIQTRAFHSIALKLTELVAILPVTVVYPVIRRKTLHAVAEDGTIGRGRVSPRKQTIASILPELYGVKGIFGSPGLDFLVLAFEASEYRSLAAATPRRRSGRIDLVPVGVPVSYRFETADDLRAILPDGLDANFTVKELAKALRMNAYDASKTALFLRHANLIEVRGNRGRAFLYRIVPEILPGTHTCAGVT